MQVLSFSPGLLHSWVCVTRAGKKASHLSEGSSSNHLQDLKVLLVQPHLLHFGGERFGCRQKDERSIRIRKGSYNRRLAVVWRITATPRASAWPTLPCRPSTVFVQYH